MPPSVWGTVPWKYSPLAAVLAVATVLARKVPLLVMLGPTWKNVAAPTSNVAPAVTSRVPKLAKIPPSVARLAVPVLSTTILGV